MAERRAPGRSRAAGRARVAAPDPIHAALGADLGRAMLRRGAKATWSPVLRLELAESYGFPDGFLGALRACLAVHDVLAAERSSPRFVVWQRRWLPRRRAVEAFGEGHLGP